MVYGDSFYNSEGLRLYAAKFLAVLPKGTEALISGGSSGCAIASAMLTLSEMPLKHRHYYKKDSVGHRGQTKRDAGLCLCDAKCVIVDDLIDCGNTVRAMASRADGESCNLIGIIVGELYAEAGTDLQKLADDMECPITTVDDGVTVKPKEK